MLLHRTAFITGAAQGLGKAFSEALLQKGARVCLADVQRKKGLEVEDELQTKYGRDKCMFVQCDVSSPSSFSESFKTAVSKFGHIDLMVNNAGIADESRVDETINIDLLGVIRGSMLSVEHMRKDKGGKGGVIINVASTAGLMGVYIMPTYCAAKFGIVGYHHSVSSDPRLKHMDVQYACLCPAFTDTAIIDIDEKKVLSLQGARKIIKVIGINKVETVVEAFLQLAESPNCNGDILTVTATEGIQYKSQGENKWTSRL